MQHGKWCELSVPHKGWTCTGVKVLEGDLAVCEMCERQRIKFVHCMEHPDYHATLRCGCDCAGRMEEDYVAAEARDKAMRNRTNRRSAFPELKGWRPLKQGGTRIDRDGLRATVFETADGWSGDLLVIHTGRKVSAKHLYPSERAAKLRAFDGLEVLRKQVEAASPT